MSKALLLLISLLSALHVIGQKNQPQYEHITVENGLPNGHVTKCIEDKFGYIWIGTENGLVRYDGYEKKLYSLKTGAGKDVQSMNIQELYQDKNGNVWIGTFYDGVFRYNRKTDVFEQFSWPHNAKTGLATLDVHSMLEDGLGHLYIYTYDHPKNIGYINQYDFETKRYRKFGPDLKGKSYIPNLANFLAWYNAGKGQIWIGTINGIYTFDPKADRFVGYLNSTDSTQWRNVSRIYQSPSDPNTLYCIETDASNAFRSVGAFNTITKTFRALSIPALQPKPNLTVNTLFEDKNRRLWIGGSAGLLKYDIKTGKSAHYPLKNVYYGTPASTVFTITEDHTGLLWLAVTNDMANFDPETGKIIYHNSLFREELDPNRLYYFQSAFLDKSGSLWLRDRESVHRVKKEFSAFDHYKKDPKDSLSFSGGYLFDMARLGEEKYLLSGIKGLSIWDLKTDQFHHIPRPREFGPTDIVFHLTLDHSGELWGGLMQADNQFKGLFRYNFKTRKTRFYNSKPDDPRSPSSDFVSFLYTDSKNDIWVGSYNKGLCRYNRDTDDFTRFPFTFRETKKPDGELDDLAVNRIFEDRSRTLWVGTLNGGLNKFDPATGKFKSYFDQQKGLRHITSIYEDKKGRFWAGSETYGLILFDRRTGHSQLFSEKDGLLSNGLIGISEDLSGKLWLSTNRGLSRFDPETETFRSFTKEQGLPSTRLTSSTARLDDGRMLVSSYGGFFTFDPAKLVINNIPPQTHISSLTYLKQDADSHENKEISLPVFGSEKILLSHDQNRLEFKYAGIHYKNADQNQYMYRLEGYENQWINAGTKRSALYTNLEPGTYTFHVKASNADGVWNEGGDSFTFEIQPPWWATWWAYLIYLFAFGVALRSYIYYRSKALRRENQLLEEKINIRTQELSNANKTLNEQRDQLSEAITELKSTQQQLIQSEKLASLGELTAGIAHEIQNPLNFVNNFSEVSAELAEEMEEELRKGDQEEALAIAGDLKQNLQKILHHGQRAGGIVRSMLQHSRKNSGEREITDINMLTDEFLKLSYHGLRAKDSSFNSKMTTHFAADLPKVKVIPQDMGRVLLNLFNNAFYAVHQKQKTAEADYQPEVSVTTSIEGAFLVLRVRDNGTGIPDSIKDKILQPFFTTKPTGEGTGLGLSLSYDILKSHGSKLEIESREGEYTVFSVFLPV